MVPPTGNGVLNQIPAGDGRESSREQVVPDDGAPALQRHLSWGPGDHIPLIGFSKSQWQSRLPDPPKKKKKKVERSGGRGGVEVEVETTHGQ